MKTYFTFIIFPHFYKRLSNFIGDIFVVVWYVIVDAVRIVAADCNAS